MTTSSVRGRKYLSVGAAALAMAITAAPSALIVAIIAIGALGEMEYSRLGAPAVVIFLGMAVATGYLVYDGLTRAWSEPGRRPADVWIAFVAALTVLLIGVAVIPVVIVFVAVDSDHSLSDRAFMVELMWLIGHLGAGFIAFLIARWLFGGPREVAESPRTDG
ncbi:MAG: hypothetical protein ACR2OI_00285 [Acidimicrobiia bacterium]